MMMRANLVKSILLLVCGFSFSAHAATSGSIASCYASNKIEASTPEIESEYFIIMDETTVLDDSLKSSLFSISQSILRPGVKFSIVSFSAFAQGRYLTTRTAGTLEAPMPKSARSSVGVKVLKSLDACMKGQLRFGLDLAYKAENSVLQAASSDLQKSDVIASFSEVSRLIKASQAPKKTVLIVSDMLENSSITSFYAKNAVKKIDPAKEMKIVTKEKMLADFAGADIYVMGAGLVNEGTKAVYRDPKTMAAIKAFWMDYFSSSNGNLVEFGMPALLNPPQ